MSPTLLKQKGLRGAGGGGGKDGGGGASRAAVESPDSLRSIEYARVLDAVSEGEIEGPAKENLLECIYLNDVVVQNPDGTMNFTGVIVDYRTGTQVQSYLPGFPALESEHAVAVKVTKLTPVVRSITNPNVDTVRVTVSVPALTTQNITNGDLSGGEVQLAFQVQTNGGGFVPVTIPGSTISGKTTSRYQRSYLIPLPRPGTAWDIKVLRLTDDNPPANIQNETCP